MQKSTTILVDSSKKFLTNRQIGLFKGIPQPKLPKIREVGYPILNKTPVVKNIKNAFDLIKSGIILFYYLFNFFFRR